MTVHLSANSSRGMAAARFGTELRAAMRARKVGARRLAEASGTATSAIGNWKAGLNLPRVDTAARIAEVLDWPKLVDLARAGRTLVCGRCQRKYVQEGGNGSRFCSVDCREIDTQLRAPGAGAELAQSLRNTLAFRQGMKGGVPKHDLEIALIRYGRSESRRVQRRDKALEHITGLRGLIDAMCAACEPEGLCRTPACPLRPASPLPIAGSEARGPVRAVEGAWGPTHRPKLLAAIREANAERWSRPGERERMAEQTRARWAGMSDAEREAAGQLISVRRRAVPA